MRSLFIVALPRSLSSLTFRAARDALGLKPPAWAEIGEILNHDLHTLSNWPKLSDSNRKFLTRERDPARFDSVLAFLEQVVSPEGYIYKDVVNPFVVAEWPGLRKLRVLKIRRNLADVAFAMQRRGWAYPRIVAPSDSPISSAAGKFADSYFWNIAARRLLRAMWHGRATAVICRDAFLQGLICADDVLEKLPGESVQYDDLIASEEPLRQALVRLYPEAAIPPIRYIDDAFRLRYRETLARRNTRPYRSISHRIEQLRSRTR
ncbi:MAG: hypothetical protein HY270_02960 [Deltaproteobacteria bacterium]|nr:hypothetical protein [Deltaproteobacteria bacterium]